MEKEPGCVKGTKEELGSNWCSVTAKSVPLCLQLVWVMENTVCAWRRLGLGGGSFRVS